MPSGENARAPGREPALFRAIRRDRSPGANPPEAEFPAGAGRQPSAVAAEGDHGIAPHLQVARARAGIGVPDLDDGLRPTPVGAGRHPAAVGADGDVGQVWVLENHLLGPAAGGEDERPLTPLVTDDEPPAVRGQVELLPLPWGVQPPRRADPQMKRTIALPPFVRRGHDRPALHAAAPCRDQAAVRWVKEEVVGLPDVEGRHVPIAAPIPEMHAVVAAPGQQPAAQAEIPAAGAADPGRTGQGSALRATPRHFPDFFLRAVVGRPKQPVVSAELGGRYTALLAQQQFPGQRVPQPQDLVPTLTGQQVTAVVEDDRADLGLMAAQDRLPPPLFHVPCLDRVLVGTDGQETAARVPGHNTPAYVTCQGPRDFAGNGIPDSDAVLLPGLRESPVVRVERERMPAGAD